MYAITAIQSLCFVKAHESGSWIWRRRCLGAAQIFSLARIPKQRRDKPDDFEKFSKKLQVLSLPDGLKY